MTTRFNHSQTGQIEAKQKMIKWIKVLDIISIILLTILIPLLGTQAFLKAHHLTFSAPYKNLLLFLTGITAFHFTVLTHVLKYILVAKAEWVPENCSDTLDKKIRIYRNMGIICTIILFILVNFL